MPVVNIRAFSGLKPIVDPVLLGNGDATVAKNVRLVSGTIEALLGTTTLKATTKSSPVTIYRYGNSSNETEYWLEFTTDTDVIRSPVPNNQYGLLYWSDGAQIKYAPDTAILSGSSYPGASYNLGVPAPTGAPTASGTAATVAAKSETRTYVVTYVSAYGEEGPPSPASNLITIDPDQAVTLSNLPTGPGGAINLATKRIYRSSTVGNQAQFQFVAEIALATTLYSDTVKQADLGETLSTDEWYPPPADLKGLKIMANNSAIAFKDNTVYVSESGVPHAWPYRYTVPAQVVGLGVFRQTAVILTNGRPFAMTATDPQAMVPEPLELPQACLSKGSIVEDKDGIMYASPDGLVSIGSAGMDVITKELFSKDQWAAYNPSSFKAALYDKKYIATFTRADGSRGMLILDFSGQGAPVTECDINASTAITALYTDVRTDTLYMVQGGNIVRFNAGSALTYNWKSKTFRMPFPLNMGFGQLIATAYPVTMNVYGDGVLRGTKTVSDNNVFKLPGGYRAQDYQIEVIGTSKVSQVNLATSTQDIKSV